MVSKTPRPVRTQPLTVEEGAPLHVTIETPKPTKPNDTGTAIALVLAVVAAGVAWYGWNEWRHGQQFPAPVVRDGVVVFDGFGGDAPKDGLPVEANGVPFPESSTLVTVVEEATPVTDSGEVLPTSSTIVALPTSPTQAVVAAGDVLSVPTQPAFVQVFSPRAELASQLGLLISAAKANLTTTPELAKALIPWAEQGGDAGLVALLTPLATQPVVVTEAAPQGPAWLQRWVVVKKKPANSYAPDPLVLETLIQYYIQHYVTPAAAPAPLSEQAAPVVAI